jgi:predicted deacetylase
MRKSNIKIVVGIILIMSIFSMSATASNIPGKITVVDPLSKISEAPSGNMTKAPPTGITGTALAYPKNRMIVLRMDDVQGYYLNTIVMNLTDTVLKYNMAITLGVIPDSCIDKDTLIKNYLISKSKDSRVELAQHGYRHYENYSQLNESDAYSVTNLGYKDMVKILKVYPVTFIPPYNEYNENTVKAIAKLNFHILSAGQGEYMLDNKIKIIGYNTLTKYSSQNDLIPIGKVLNDCNASLNQKNLCVVMIHPEDYVSEDDVHMNQTRYNEFVKLLGGLKSFNAKFTTFKGLT